MREAKYRIATEQVAAQRVSYALPPVHTRCAAAGAVCCTVVRTPRHSTILCRRSLGLCGLPHGHSRPCLSTNRAFIYAAMANKTGDLSTEETVGHTVQEAKNCERYNARSVSEALGQKHGTREHVPPPPTPRSPSATTMARRSCPGSRLDSPHGALKVLDGE